MIESCLTSRTSVYIISVHTNSAVINILCASYPAYRYVREVKLCAKVSRFIRDNVLIVMTSIMVKVCTV